MPMPKNVGPYWANPRFIQRLNSRFAIVRGCRIWQGYIMPEGYGQIGYGDNLIILTHRAVWAVANQQDVPHGMDICHTCDIRACGDEEHLFVGTRLDNMEDAKLKQRTPTGSRNKRAKLTEGQVMDIVARYRIGESAVALAGRFEIARGTVGDIVAGRRWGHLWTDATRPDVSPEALSRIRGSVEVGAR